MYLGQMRMHGDVLGDWKKRYRQRKLAKNTGSFFHLP